MTRGIVLVPGDRTREGLSGVILGSNLQTGTPSVGAEYLLPAFAGALLGAGRTIQLLMRDG
jgi:hypothetical protein